MLVGVLLAVPGYALGTYGAWICAQLTHRMHHGGPQGAIGGISAENNLFQRIQLRLHAEFDLPDGKYTPSQFAGELVVDRSSNKIIALRLAVPSRRNNVDLNWERETPEGEVWADADGNILASAPSEIIADIGFCEQMELVGGDWNLVESVRWDREIAARDLDKSFQKNFYTFAQMDWLPWEQAVAESLETGNPLHVVALFGTLDDESC